MSANDFFEKELIDSAELQYQKAFLLTDSGTHTHQFVKYNYARFLKKTGRHEAAAKHLDEIIQELEPGSVSDSIFLARTYQEFAITNSQLGNFQKGIHYCDKALAIIEHLKEPDYELLSTLYASKGVLFAYLSVFDEASVYLEKGLEIDLRLGTTDSMRLASAYNNLGVINKWMGDLEKASEYFEITRKLRISLLGEDHPLTADIYSNIGNLYTDLGKFERALEYLEKALTIRKGKISQEILNVAGIYNNISRVYQMKNQPGVALKYAKLSVGQYQENNQLDHPSLAEKYSTLADIYKAMQRYDTALQCSYRSNKIIIENLGTEDRNYIINLLFQAELNIDNGNLFRSAKLFDEVIMLSKKLYGINHPFLAQAYRNKGNIALQNQTQDSALFYYHQAVLANAVNFTSSSIDEIPVGIDVLSIDEYLKAIEGKIAVYRSKLTSQPEEFTFFGQKLIDLLMTGDKIIDKQSARYIQYTDRISFQERVYGFYQNGVAICYELYGQSGNREFIDKAHFLMEKYRFNIFLFKANSPGLLRFESIPDSLISKEKALKISMNYYESKMLDQLSAEQIDSISLQNFKNRFFQLSESYDKLIQLFERDYAAYFNLKYGNRITSLAEIREQMSREKSIISYYRGKDALYLILISNKKTEFKQIEIDQEFNGVVDRYLFAIKNPDFSDSGQHELNLLGDKLHEKLIQPIEAFIDKYKDLLIIPDDQIALIPFEAIPTKAEGYLLNKWNISYSSSVSLLNTQKDGSTVKYDRNVLAIAPFVANNQMSNAATLKWADEEVNAIESHLPSRFLKGEAATESNFRSEAEHFSIIHLATHSILDQANPLLSNILFARDDELASDGVLYAKELFGMKIPADMVVLSSCDTGNGKIVKGEGVISLAKGFFYAGSKSVVMSLWKANDRTSSVIMDKFYQYLSEGKRKDEAMRLSKLNYLVNAKGFESHPVYWAQFLVNGDTKPLKEKSPRYVWLLFFAILIISLLFVKRKAIHRMMNG